MDRLKDRVAIITGGGSGIGLATCRRFVEEGGSVVIAEINADAGARAAEEINSTTDGAAEFIATDVTDESSVCRMVEATIERFGRIDILVNNAAVFIFQGVDATVQQWRDVLDVNVIGAATVTKHVVPHLRAAGNGAIVNLASISSFVAQRNFVTYNASKAAIAAMTRCLALDLAEDGIRVNAVCPGTVWTPIVEKLAGEQNLDRAAAETHPDFGGAHMIQRIAEPREIANAILFLASDEASFITGEHLMVDGGYTAQ